MSSRPPQGNVCGWTTNRWQQVRCLVVHHSGSWLLHRCLGTSVDTVTVSKQPRDIRRSQNFRQFYISLFCDLSMTSRAVNGGSQSSLWGSTRTYERVRSWILQVVLQWVSLWLLIKQDQKRRMNWGGFCCIRVRAHTTGIIWLRFSMYREWRE